MYHRWYWNRISLRNLIYIPVKDISMRMLSLNKSDSMLNWITWWVWSSFESSVCYMMMQKKQVNGWSKTFKFKYFCFLIDHNFIALSTWYSCIIKTFWILSLYMWECFLRFRSSLATETASNIEIHIMF